MERALFPYVVEDLRAKMVLLSGARQVGKTTLARALLPDDAGYLNWDVTEHRERLLRGRMPAGDLWVLDEIHKHRGWRNFVKGLWDGRRAGQRILVTGSARLDLARRAGDSLQGRHHLLRLHPLSAAELSMRQPCELKDLLALGGFPEPFLCGSLTRARRWSREYRSLLVREEITQLDRVDDLGKLELMSLRLPELVGSPLSVNGLREDLQVAHRTAERWLGLFERLFALFLVPPFGTPRLRAVKKARKHFHMDWTLVEADGPRFENLVACHLLKWVHLEQDTAGRDLELCYFRDVDGREVDFVVCEKRRPILFVECKHGDAEIDAGLRYLCARFPKAAAWQVSAIGKRDYVSPEHNIRVAPALALLSTLA